MPQMNRALIIAASSALIVLLLCAAWLLWHDPSPSRIHTVARDNTAAPAQDVRPGTSSGTPASNTQTAPGANAPEKTNAPKPEPGNVPPDPQPKPDQPKPDFRRTPGTERPLPAETESKKLISTTISGRVQLESGTPVADADVHLEVVVMRRMKGTPDDASSPLQKVATSDQNGAFSFTLEREIYESAKLTAFVSARARGYGPSAVTTLEVTGESGMGASVTLTLADGGNVRGRVVDTQGNAVPGVKVVLGKYAPHAERPAHAGECFEVVTDTSGAYSFDDVRVGSYPIGVLSYAHNYRSGPKQVVVSRDAAPLEDIVLEVVISIRVCIADATGAKVAGTCTLSFSDGKKVVQRLGATVPEDGLIVLGYPPAGTFDVTAHIDGYFDSAPVRLTFTPGQMTDAGTLTLTKDPDYVKQH